MRIAMISEHASPLAHIGGVDAGGQNVHVADLSAALARRGHEIAVYTRRDDAELPDRVPTELGYTVVHVPAGPARGVPKDELLQYMTQFGQFLTTEWTSEPPDVAHAHFWMSGLATQQAAGPQDVPTVQTFHALGVTKRMHQGVDDTSPDSRIRLEAEIARAADWVAATSTDEVFELARMGRPRARTTVVPCGVDADKFYPHGPAAPRDDCLRILSVGRLVPRKGFATLIEALSQIPGAELVIAGGPQRSQLSNDSEAGRLRELAAQFGVSERVHFYGAVSRGDMPALFRSADVVACTPWYEPFGIVPLEAMACGVPVVATAVGGIRDTVVDGDTGRLVPPKDPRQTAEAIATLLTNARLRADMGRAGRERVCARYTWDRIAADTERIYDKLIASRRDVAAAGRQSG